MTKSLRRRLAKTRRLFCPASQGRHAKLFILPKYSIYDLTNLSRLDTRGVRPIVTEREAGCGGRCWCADDARWRGRSSCVVVIPRRWDQVGGDHPSAMEANKPGLRRERKVSRKPLRRECRSDFGVPVFACVRLFSFCPQSSGCGVHPAFPAPSVFRGTPNCKTRTQIAAGECDLTSAPLARDGR